MKHKGRRPFGLSFRDAWAGIRHAVKTERNMRIHVVAAVCVLAAACLLDISRGEWLVLLLTISLVLVAELLNTAIEAAVDLYTSSYHPLAEIAKNTAAGAVLLVAVNAVVVGGLIFYDKIVLILKRLFF
ncbi:MAG: diacylglycerol kinase family protein [Thermoanaerobacteraceae bacterium]|nr:diacylglycerol kinase family protein [Thermoanaerobacteraceae bacterium]